jgi:hypothetical protein
MSHKHCPPKSKTVKIFGIEYTKPSTPVPAAKLDQPPSPTGQVLL